MTLSLPPFTRFLVRAVSLLVLLLSASLLAQGQTIRYVRTNGTNSDPTTATSWATSTTNLQGAINASAATDQVWVATGTYKPGGNANTNRDLSFAMKNGVAIFGGFRGVSTETSVGSRPAVNPIPGPGGASQPSSTTLSGEIGNLTSTTDNSYHVIKNSAGITNTAILDGFVITGGNANGDSQGEYGRGGGMFNQPNSRDAVCSPLIRNCSFLANSAGYGGAMYNEAYGASTHSSPTLINCSFQGNTAGLGGAMANNAYSSQYSGGGQAHSNPTLTNCTFQSNSANSGGAMHSSGTTSPGGGGESSPTLTNCSFRTNSAANVGGAMVNTGFGSFGASYPRLTNCSFEGNSAIYGGGMANDGTSGGRCQPTLTNCSFQANSASGDYYSRGGAIYNDGRGLYTECILTLTNCSFQGNTASFGGGAISSLGYPNGLCNSELTNCVLFGNGGAKTFYNDGANVFASYTLLEASVTNSTDWRGGTTRVTVTPFASSTGTQLAINSPAINTGDPTTTTATVGMTDLAGNPRIANCRVDMGAFEIRDDNFTRLAITGGPATSSVVCVGSDVSETVSVSGTGPFSYRWYKDSFANPVYFQTTATLTLRNIQPNGAGSYSDAGSYSLVVTGSCNSVTSTAFNLTAIAVPSRLYVNASAVGANTGVSWPDAFTSLQSALTYSCSQNLTEIWVAAGTYKPTTSTTDRTASFALKNGVAIYGGFAGSETALTGRPAINPVAGPGGASQPNAARPSSTTLSGDIGALGNGNDNSFHVINNSNINNTAVLDGFVITGGAGSDLGGGMLNNGSSPTIRNCSFVGNSVSASGGLSTRGGAMFNGNGSSPQLTNCIFLSNSASGGSDNFGGAMANESSSNPQLTNCVFLNNLVSGSAGNQGGAMANTGSSPKLTNCVFLSNSASGGTSSRGGAMVNDSSNPQLTNCSFRDNSVSGGSDNFGGAMANSNGSSPQLTNCVVFDNGGSNTFYNVGSPAIAATYSLFDNTVTGYSTPTNLTTSTSPFASPTSVSLAANSPAIDAGLSSASGLTGILTDLAGNTRLVGCRVDMGALEFQNNTNQTLAFTRQPASVSVVCAFGTTVAVPVSVSGTVTSYQWYNGAGAISGQTTATLALSNMQPGDGGSYSVVVTGACNSVTSTGFNLTVNARPSRLYVNASAMGANTGLSWPNAFTSLQSALTYSCSQNLTEIWVAAGTYKPTGTPTVPGTDRTASFALKNGVAVYGGFAGVSSETALTDRPAINPVAGPGGASQPNAARPSSTTLSGNIGALGNGNDNSFHVINNPASLSLTTTAVLDGFVITGGAGSDLGGGMFNDGSSPTIRNCSFVGNSVSASGGLSTRGGAMYNGNGSSPQLTNCSFVNNSVSASGGITNSFGGAIANFTNSSPQLTNCVFLNNQVWGSALTQGGAMANSLTCNPQLTNCSFQANSASGGTSSRGGAIHNGNSNPQLTNCSFRDNSVSGATNNLGGAMSNIGTSSPQLTNCVVFDNGGSNTFYTSTTSSIGATYSLFDNTVTGYSSDPTNLTTSTSPFASPTSVSLAVNSLAIDTGLNSASGLSGILTDLAGNPRIMNCRVDMGALEVQANTNQTFAITGGPATSSVVCAAGEVSVPVSVSGTGPFAYQWYKGSFTNPVAGQTSATLTLSNSQTSDGGSYSLVVTGACNSLTSTAFSLTVNSPPTVANAGISQTITIGTTATLAANLPTVGTGSWSVVSGPSTDQAQFSSKANPAAVFTPGGGVGSYDLVWTITNAPCTPSSSSLTITVIGANTAPVATGNTNQTATVGTAFSYTVNAFTDAESPNALTYTASLSPANGFSFDPVTRVISGTPLSTIVSSVTITATDAGGLSASTTFSITASCPSLTASISGALTVCGGQSTELTASGGATYVWNMGATTPTISATAGAYSVTVTTSGCSATATATVRANPAVVAAIGGTLTVCSGQSTSLTASGGSSYGWNTGATTAMISATAGTYSVTVSSGLCSATTTATVTEKPPVTATLLASGNTVTCADNSVTLTAGGGQTYTFSAGATQVGSTNQAIVRSGGTYTVTVGNANGCTATATTTISSNMALITVSNPTTNTATQGTAFNQPFTAAGGTGPYSYSVVSGNLPTGLSLATTTGVLSGTPTQTGSFTFTVRATDANSCAGVGATYSLTVNAPVVNRPTITGLAASPSPVCGGSPVTFTATVSNVNGPYAFTLTNGSNGVTGTASSMAFSQALTAGGSGSQSFTLIVNNGGSVATAITTVLVNPLPTVSLLVSGGVLQAAAAGGVLFERVIVIDRINGYEIRQADSNTTGFFSITRTGPYRITVTNANGCRATVEGRIDTLP